MMVRTQVTLDAELQRQARQRAAQSGISLAEYFRRLVRRDLGEPPEQPSPAAVFNLGNSGGSDIATAKDALIAEAVVADRSPRSPDG